jgi:hypothetical protein
MMKLRPPLLLCSVAALALVAACDSPPARNPRTTQTVVLSPDHAETSVTMQLVSAIRVVLPGPDAGTGLSWEIGSNNTKVLDQMSPMKAVPATGAPGSAATTTVSFYALRPGRSVIRFFLVHPNAAIAVPAASCTLKVLVED